MILVPLVAACGATVLCSYNGNKKSMGFDYGMLNTIHNVCTTMDQNKILIQLGNIGCAIINQNFPLIGRMYALGDVTSTLDSWSLLAIHIMSSRLINGVSSTVITMTSEYQHGGEFPNLNERIKFAKKIVELGWMLGIQTTVIITSSKGPWGNSFGYVYRMKEVIEILSGRSIEPLVSNVCAAGRLMLVNAGITDDQNDAETKLRNALSNGDGLEKLKELITMQGGDCSVCDDVEVLPKASLNWTLKASHSGYMKSLDMKTIADLFRNNNDPTFGFILLKHIGEQVKRNEDIVTIYANNQTYLYEAIEVLQKSIIICNNAQNLILGKSITVTREGVNM